LIRSKQWSRDQVHTHLTTIASSIWFFSRCVDHKAYVLHDSNVHAPYMIWTDWFTHGNSLET